ncbi:hypothetical protein BT96DRAFT_237714 [Gymnopus androsaceus JB14]|uniref:Uncharacterized protein n=1 Tax=Gymnopus androsaceus JB14 TaxID=1447944 RepID=A0A6A4IPM6_9AGAR|nr:hypothetical protein BT96DRAFT_237714 [Gymnopus androsaceus JB14]
MTDSRFRFLYEFNGELIPRTRSEDSSTLKSLLLDDVIQAVVAPFIEKTFELTTVDLSHLKVYRSSLEEMNHILENQHRHVPFSPALGEEIKNLERIVEYNIVIWRDEPVNAGNAIALYRKAWGERWPQRQEIILKTQIGEPDDYDDGYPYPGAYADIPDHFTYVCLDQMHEVAKNLYLSTKLNDIIVVRKEYEWLCDRLEKTAEDLVITGHPGIGV